jgi:small subunit ribosomal protein S20
MRQTKVRTVRNKAQRSTLRTAVKNARSASAEEMPAALQKATVLIDRASQKNLVHPNTAARTKSRLAKLANKAAQG